MKRLAILGASGHGKVAADIAEKNGWKKIHFFDAVWPEKKIVSDWNIIGDEFSFWKELENYDGVFIAIGNNFTRKDKIEKLTALKKLSINLIAPSAAISSCTQFGNGVLIAEQACINIDSIIDDGVIINTGATVDHDCSINSFSHICPGTNLAGNVSIGSLSLIGIGSSVIQGIKVGKGVVAGAGSVIVNNIPDNVTVIGVPAKNVDKGKSTC